MKMTIILNIGTEITIEPMTKEQVSSFEKWYETKNIFEIFLNRSSKFIGKNGMDVTINRNSISHYYVDKN